MLAQTGTLISFARHRTRYHYNVDTTEKRDGSVMGAAATRVDDACIGIAYKLSGTT